MSKAAIASKIQKLYEKAYRTENQEESLAFMEKVNELLLKNELTMSEVEYLAAKEEDPMGRTVVCARGEWKGGKFVKTLGPKPARTRIAWQENLADAICTGHFCKYVVLSGSNEMWFIGRKSHREMAEYLYLYLAQQIEEQVEIEYIAEWKRNPYGYQGFKDPFRRGFVAAVRDRLRKKLQEQKAEAQASGHGMALIRLDNAHQAATKYMQESFKTKTAASLSGRYTNHGTARDRGYSAGSNANLSPGVGSGGSAPKRIGGGS